MLQNERALSPVISAIILIAITVAVAIAATSWMGSMSFNFMKTEELRITSCMWAPDSSHANITMTNTGSNKVSIKSVQLDGTAVAEYTFMSGDSTVDAGETVTIKVFDFFVGNARHQFSVITNGGSRFVFVSKAPQTSATFKMEWGTIENVNDDFTQVNLQNSYFSPVIVCTPEYTSGVPRSIRVTDVTCSSFSVRVQNPSSDVCPDTDVHFLVAEEGVWTSPIKLEARKYVTATVGQDDDWDYDTRTFGQDYSGNIVVFHQVMSCNDPSWITTYVSKENSKSSPPSSGDDGFRIALNGAEAVDSHDSENVGYIILEEGYGEIDGIKYNAKQTADSIEGFDNSPPYLTDFAQSFDGTPDVLVSTQLEMDGGNGGWVVNYSLSQTQAGLMIDEDQVENSERSHIDETCGFIAFETAGTYTE
jgi:flagellin-like protein